MDFVAMRRLPVATIEGPSPVSSAWRRAGTVLTARATAGVPERKIHAGFMLARRLARELE
jgi:hypothetical protein